MANRLSSTHVWVELALQLCNWWAWVGSEARSGWTGLLDLPNMGLFLSWYITDFHIHMLRSLHCFSILTHWKKCSDVQSSKSLHASLVWLNWSNPTDLWTYVCVATIECAESCDTEGTFPTCSSRSTRLPRSRHGWDGYQIVPICNSWCGKYLASHITSNGHDRILGPLPTSFASIPDAQYRGMKTRSRTLGIWAGRRSDEVDFSCSGLPCDFWNSVLPLTLRGLWVRNWFQRIYALSHYTPGRLNFR